MTQVDIFIQLEEADAAYADGFPLMSDDEYDALRSLAKIRDPKNQYFKQVGAPVVRGISVPLPIPLGSLNQVYENELIDFITKNKLDEYGFVVSAKLDGVSVYLEYDDHLISAYTRGDGYEGQDITQLVKAMKRVPQQIGTQTKIRAEIIMEEDVFKTLNEQGKLGRTYKNARNYVAGQVNKNDPGNQAFVNCVSIVAYEIFGDNFKNEQIEHLYERGFQVVDWDQYLGKHLTLERLTTVLQQFKESSEFALDGIVIDVDSSETRKRLEEDKGSSSLNPEYAWKFKINDNRLITEVVHVHWNISKNGYLKPRVQVTPIELAGVTITYATGFNAKFIKENGIGPGAEISITRSGEVIPFIEKVITKAIAQLPTEEEFGEMVWTNGEVDLKLIHDHDDAKMGRMIDFFAGIDADQLRVGSIAKLFEAGYDDLTKVIRASREQLVQVLGVNGSKAYDSLKAKLNPIEQWKLAGASQLFGRGIGRRKMAKLFEAYGTVIDLSYDQIIKVEGFEAKTAEKIVEGNDNFKNFLQSIEFLYSYKKIEKIEGALSGFGVCFTGIRDKNLEAAIISKGGRIDSSVTSKTTHLVCLDPTSGSGKLKKAADKGVAIFSIENARRDWL